MQLSVDGTPNVAIVVAKLVPGVEVVRSAKLEMTAIVDGVFWPNRQSSAVRISATVRTLLRQLVVVMRKVWS